MSESEVLELAGHPLTKPIRNDNHELWCYTKRNDPMRPYHVRRILFSLTPIGRTARHYVVHSIDRHYELY